MVGSCATLVTEAMVAAGAAAAAAGGAHAVASAGLAAAGAGGGGVLAPGGPVPRILAGVYARLLLSSTWAVGITEATQRVPQEVLELSRKVDQCKALDAGRRHLPGHAEPRHRRHPLHAARRGRGGHTNTCPATSSKRICNPRLMNSSTTASCDVASKICQAHRQLKPSKPDPVNQPRLLQLTTSFGRILNPRLLR